MKTVQDLLKDCHDLAIDAPQSVNAVQSKKQNKQAARLRRTQQLRQRGPQHNRSPTSQPGLAKQEEQQEPPRRHRRPTVAKAPAGAPFVHPAAAYSPDVSTHEPFKKEATGSLAARRTKISRRSQSFDCTQLSMPIKNIQLNSAQHVSQNMHVMPIKTLMSGV